MNKHKVDPEPKRACRVYGEHTRADMMGNGTFLSDFLADHSWIDFAVSSYPLAWRDQYHRSGDPIAGRQASAHKKALPSISWSTNPPNLISHMLGAEFTAQAAYIAVMRDPVRRVTEHYMQWGNQITPFPPQPAPPASPPHPGRMDMSGGGFTGKALHHAPAPFNAHHFAKRQSSLSAPARFVEWLRTQPDNLMVRMHNMEGRLHEYETNLMVRDVRNNTLKHHQLSIRHAELCCVWQVRLLCGWLCSRVARGQLERKHFDAATTRLQSFAVRLRSRASDWKENTFTDLMYESSTMKSSAPRPDIRLSRARRDDDEEDRRDDESRWQR
jgi:hypothetical protein